MSMQPEKNQMRQPVETMVQYALDLLRRVENKSKFHLFPLDFNSLPYVA
jgi:predicted ATP-dependent Lon-type protease